MNPGIVQAVTKLAEGIHYLHTKDFHPERLSGNMLALFQKFKTSYDSKDIPGLSSVISDAYSGSLYGAKNKFSFVQLFNEALNSHPNFTYPSLTINIYQITGNTDQKFSAIMNFQSYLKVAFVPIASIDSGQIYVEVRPKGHHGIWKITRIDSIEN